MEPQQVIIFNLGKQDFACDILSVREVVRLPDITPVFAGLDFLEGMINLRGRILPVIDLRKRLGLKKGDYDRHSRIMIAETNGRPVGFVVDRVSGVEEIDPASVEPPPSELTGSSFAGYIDGVADKDNRLLVIIDLRKILSPVEIGELESDSPGAGAVDG